MPDPGLRGGGSFHKAEVDIEQTKFDKGQSIVYDGGGGPPPQVVSTAARRALRPCAPANAHATCPRPGAPAPVRRATGAGRCGTSGVQGVSVVRGRR